MNYMNILRAVLSMAALGLLFGIILAIAAKLFAVKKDERTEKICALLPGANCGGCGYAGCASLAEAIVRGEASPSACGASDDNAVAEIAAVMGKPAEREGTRMRAQVMCSGTHDKARKKYEYSGVPDCAAALRLGGGNKECPNGCIGLGSCVAACRFGAISVEDGVAVVDYEKCTGCGACVGQCPKHIIKLIPYESSYWVGCLSAEKGASTRKFCDAGCIGCSLCEKACEVGAITVSGNCASIDYEKCTDCGKCVKVCPRKIISSGGNKKEQKK